MKAGREFRKTRQGIDLHEKLFSDNLFNLVTDKSTKDENDDEHKYLKEDAGRSQGPEIDAYARGEIVLRSEHEDDPEDKADNDTIFEETVIVFLSLVEKAKRDTQNQVQYFK